MNFDDIINDFIEKYPDYKSDIVNFSEYVEKYWENSYMQQMMFYMDKCDMLAGIVEQEWKDATSFRKAMAAIGIKLRMLYGITYRELRKIKWSDYDEIYVCIIIIGIMNFNSLNAMFIMLIKIEIVMNVLKMRV